MTYYTSGPWTYTQGAGRWVIDSSHAHAIACTAGYEPMNEANARLIAASPDLLENLQEAILWAESEPTDNQTYREAIARMRAAVVKATSQ